MSSERKNLLIGRGEKLFQEGVWPSAGRKKPDPYSLVQQQSLLLPVLADLVSSASQVDRALAPRGEIAAKITVHPEFLAKSYFPKALLRNSGLRLLGSRGSVVTPRGMVHGKPPKGLPTAVLIVAGSKSDFERTAGLLVADDTANKVQEDLRRIEVIAPFLPQDRKHGLDLSDFNGWAEVVLHAGFQDKDILDAFFDLVVSLGGRLEPKRARTVGGLTFLPVDAAATDPSAFVREIEDFTHLRTIRNMPLLAVDPFQPQAAISRTLSLAPALPTYPAMDEDIRALILDGGFKNNLLPWVKASDALGVPPVASDLQHGMSVTSAFLFGHIQETQQSLPRPFCNVEHVRVLPSTATDSKVGDVIDRIIDTLQAARDEGRPYELANLSLGPKLPILDDDPHEWTVRLDEFLSLGDLFMTIAAGNDGHHGTDLGRIQPPSDAVNAFSVGASTGHDKKSHRASYSCLGPGRSPGLVKPDAVAFGGIQETPLRLVDPQSGTIKLCAGTSYSAPLAMRLAAGVMASLDQELQATMLHALLVSRAQFNRRNGHDQTEVGWGVLPESHEDIIYSPDDEVVVMYQGFIAKGYPIRAAIPLPQGLPADESVKISATFAYRAPIDPAHPVSYTRAGLEVLFQPDGKKSEGFFSSTKYDTEQDLRNDALKWETCRHRQRSISIGKMTDPCFMIRYQGREEGAPDPDTATDQNGDSLPAELQPSQLPFALVIRLKVSGQSNMSQLVLEQFKALSEVPIKVQARV